MYVYRNPHEQTLLMAQQQRQVLEAERQQISERLVWLNQTIAQLDAHISATSQLVENDPSQFMATAGLTLVCKLALDRSAGWFTAQDIRQHLANCGIDLSPYANPMAVLHTTLGRVGESMRSEDGNLYYARKGTPTPPS